MRRHKKSNQIIGIIILTTQMRSLKQHINSETCNYFINLKTKRHGILVTYLLRHHVRKLILWPFQSKERSNNKPTSKRKAYSKLLGHNHHDRQEQGKCNENEEDTAGQK